MTTRDHEEVRVGGPMDEARLREIMVRGWLFRNLSVSADEAFEYKAPPWPGSDGSVPPWSDFGGTQHTDGETPTIVEIEGNDDRRESIQIHVGCGEMCPVFAEIPYDGDCGCAPRSNADAIVHAGRDLIDLVREVVSLREQLHSEQGQHQITIGEFKTARARAEHFEGEARTYQARVNALEGNADTLRAMLRVTVVQREAAKAALAHRSGLIDGPGIDPETLRKAVGELPTDLTAYEAAVAKSKERLTNPDRGDAVKGRATGSFTFREFEAGPGWAEEMKRLAGPYDQAVPLDATKDLPPYTYPPTGAQAGALMGAGTLVSSHVVAPFLAALDPSTRVVLEGLLVATREQPPGSLPLDPEQRMSFVLERIYCCCPEGANHPSKHRPHCPIFRTWDSLIMSWAQSFQDIADELPEPDETPRAAIVRACLQLATDRQVTYELTRRGPKPPPGAIMTSTEIAPEMTNELIRAIDEARRNPNDFVILIPPGADVDHGELVALVLRRAAELRKDLPDPIEIHPDLVFFAPEEMARQHGVASLEGYERMMERTGVRSLDLLLCSCVATLLENITRPQHLYRGLVEVSALALRWAEVIHPGEADPPTGDATAPDEIVGG